MENKMDRPIFFLTLSFVCVWLIVDVAAGKDYVGSFLGTLFPGIFYGENKGEPTVVSTAVSILTTENPNPIIGNGLEDLTIDGKKAYDKNGMMVARKNIFGKWVVASIAGVTAYPGANNVVDELNKGGY